MRYESKRTAKKRFLTIEFWYRRKYNLPSSDPRFLAIDVQEMLTDYWAHHFYDNPKAADAIEDENFDLQAEIDLMNENPDDWDTL